jgi:hypothetical protein
LQRGQKVLFRKAFTVALRPTSYTAQWITNAELNKKRSRLFFTQSNPVRADVVTQKKQKEEEIVEQVPWVEAEEPAVPEHQRSIPEFIKELGWLPFGFLLGTALVSKELWLIGPGTILWGHIIGTSALFYFMLADAVEEYYKKSVAAEIAQYQNSWDLLVLSLKERIAIHKADIATEEFVKDLAKHWKASEIEAAKYGSLKAKHDARNEIVAQLEAIARKEKAVQAAGTKVVASALRSHVRQQWAAPDKKLKDEAFNLALNNLFTPQPIDPKTSPVFGLYLNYLRGNAKPTQQARA